MTGETRHLPNSRPKRPGIIHTSNNLSKLVSILIRKNLIVNHLLNNRTRLLISKSTFRHTKKILRLSLSIHKSSRRSSRTSLSLIKSSLTLNIRTISILHEIKVQTVGIRLSGRSQRVLGLSPNRLDPGVPLSQISNCLCLSKLSFNLSNLSLKLLRKRIRFGSGLGKGKERILLLGLDSLSLGLGSISRGKLNICLGLTRRKNLLNT